MTFSASALPQPGLCPAGQHFIHNCEMPPLCLLQTISEAKHGSLPLLTVGKTVGTVLSLCEAEAHKATSVEQTFG